MRAKEMTIKQRYHHISKPVEEHLDVVRSNQKYPRKIFSKKDRQLLPSQIIKYAINNERAGLNMEKNNTLTLIVDVNATKPQIKEAMVKLYGKAVLKVNTLITSKHYQKKAFVRFKEAGAAIEISSKIGNE